MATQLFVIAKINTNDLAMFVFLTSNLQMFVNLGAAADFQAIFTVNRKNGHLPLYLPGDHDQGRAQRAVGNGVSPFAAR